jgi:hypothetical protein
MIAGIVNLCGAFGGNMNPMFENIKVLKNIVRPYLIDSNADQFGQYPLPDPTTLRIPTFLAREAINIIQADGYTNGAWFYKGTQMNLVFPIWHYAFPNAKWIIVRRQDDDIVDSCMHTTYMNAFDKDENIKAVGAKDKRDAWYWWLRQQNKNFVSMIEQGLNVKQIHPERMVYGDYSQIHEMLDWLGLKWNSEVLNYVEPRLCKSREAIK